MLEPAAAKVHTDLSNDELIRMAVDREEGVLASNGALRVETGKRTGRSPADRFVVQDDTTRGSVDWGQVNRPMPADAAEALWRRVDEYWQNLGEKFQTHLHVCSDDRFSLPLRVRTETAWQCLFARLIFIRPQAYNPRNAPEWEVLNCPGFVCDPARDGTNSDGTVVLDFRRRRILLAGMRYAGEMKKALFSTLNYLLPEHDVLPMHCGANVSAQGSTYLFFGLSGTGKTTLSADPKCLLIGDDEHGWGDGSVFNFEGGCYAKCIDLTEEGEPVIYAAIRHGAIMENVVLNGKGEPDYASDALTENTRCCYPLEHVESRVPDSKGAEPAALIFLTCDLNGVMPPVSRLTPEAAAYHFLSGYTAAMAGVEVGAGVKPTFSTCFGAPFFPRPAGVYAELLIKRLNLRNTPVYLVNTGWCRGPHGEGHRFPIPVTRAIVHAIQSGKLDDAPLKQVQPLNLQVPTAVEGVDAELLDPRDAWQDAAACEARMQELAQQFRKNFERFEVREEIRAAGPA